MSPNAVVVSDVSKSFRVYRDRNRSLKATVLKGRRAKYEEFWALRDVSLEIAQGRTFGLLGNNGSGKSTLLKCIAQILQPNEGFITRQGRMAAMLEVGSGFHPELSGRDNIYLNGAILGMTKAEIDRKFDSIVDFSGVEDFIDQPVKNYSSGMYVRLGFSISIHVDPEILLVDEVLAVGDLAFQEKCTAKFADLRREGRTVVVVSHSLEQMRTFCDDAAWLHKGRLMGAGPANEIINQYADQAHNSSHPSGTPKPVDESQAFVEDQTMGRFGSGEVTIDRVEILDAAGADVRHARTGDRLTLRMHFTCHEPAYLASYGFSIEHESGFLLWAHNSEQSSWLPPALQVGVGTVDLVIPNLPLRAGSYRLGAGINADRNSRVLDSLPRAITFSIGTGTPVESGGVAVMHSEFQSAP